MKIKVSWFFIGTIVIAVVVFLTTFLIKSISALASPPIESQQEYLTANLLADFTDTPTEPVKLTDTPTQSVKITDTPTQPYPFPSEPPKITDTPTQPYPFPTFPQPTRMGPRPRPGGPGNLPYVIGIGGFILLLIFSLALALRQKPTQ